MPVSEETYKRIALEDPSAQWELVCGELRKKPPMTMPHNEVQSELTHQLRMQLERAQYHVRSNSARAHTSAGSYFVPDVLVIPTTLVRKFESRPFELEEYIEPLPLVVEVWSRSTGEYDVGDKLAEYRRRGDLEVWRVHPYDRTLTAWRRQPDGSYSETTYTSGVVDVASLPGVSVDLTTLWD
jgi:Uma2 family endonuclease